MARRSPCPVACTLDLVGDRWTMLIVRDMLRGKAYFKEFLASPEKISTNILAERLLRLTESGLAERVASEAPGRDAYRLTELGASLKPVLEQIARWGLANRPGTQARLAVK